MSEQGTGLEETASFLSSLSAPGCAGAPLSGPSQGRQMANTRGTSAWAQQPHEDPRLQDVPPALLAEQPDSSWLPECGQPLVPTLLAAPSFHLTGEGREGGQLTPPEAWPESLVFEAPGREKCSTELALPGPRWLA